MAVIWFGVQSYIGGTLFTCLELKIHAKYEQANV